jgi:hypothetical protein
MRAPDEVPGSCRPAPVLAEPDADPVAVAPDGIREDSMKAITRVAGLGVASMLALPANAQLLAHKDLSLATALMALMFQQEAL